MSIDSLTLRLGARWPLPVLSPRTLAVAAGFAMLYLSWGSTFLANHLALQGFPALVLAGLRFLLAGALFAVLAVARAGGARLGWHDARLALIGVANHDFNILTVEAHHWMLGIIHNRQNNGNT